ncbi:MAG: sigma 54-interacting transcriptional regulator [Myxococcales bacterium]|nr:sigma 54-interacting transcriptional regulator [Myxococcales bacterium]
MSTHITIREPRAGEPVPAGDLLLVAGPGQLLTFPLDSAEIIIGRDPQCDIVINHRTLSRRHARLRMGPPVTIEDLGSTNGLRVARESYRGGPPVSIQPGESFHIGPFSFVFVRRASETDSTSRRSGGERLHITDPTVQGVPSFVKEVALSDISVLILGDSGVGKEVLAETLHKLSRRSGELARINCAALAEPLLESELFGHERGAFTGAMNTKIGLIESAQGGTVFLDEIGELPLGIQAKLLRAVESREILRLGSTRPVKIDVRFVAATNRDLPTEVAEKRFRHDLYFRLDGITLMIPPLRERRDRIGVLAVELFSQASARANRSAHLTPDALEAISAYDWPGNVRELRAVLERSLLLCRGNEVGARHLAFTPAVEHKAATPAAALAASALPGRSADAPSSPPAAAAAADAGAAPDDPWVGSLSAEQRQDREQIIASLEACAGNQTRAAKQLGVSRTTLVNRIQLYRIPRPRS